MAAALLLAGQISDPGLDARNARKAERIQPSMTDTVRAMEQGMTFPATHLALDVSISLARRDAALVDAGFAQTVTLAKIDAPAATVEAAVQSAGPVLPQRIVQSEARIERPGRRSKTGETIVLAQADLLRTLPSGLGVGMLSGAAALADDEVHAEIGTAMVRLARESRERTGKPAMSSQAISDYLSLYVMRDRVAAIGDALARDPENPAGGAWVANLDGGGLDDALFQDGLGFGQSSFGAVAGFDAVSQNVFSAGDRLVYGAFASTFGLGQQDEIAWSGSRADMRGGSFGVFAVLDDGPFSLSALVRGDVSQTLQTAANRLDFSDAVQVLKAEVVARYRFDVSDWIVEPSAGLVYAAGQRDMTSFGQVQPQIDTAESLKVQMGVKASSVVYNKSGTSVEPSVTIMIAEELKDSGNVTFLSGGPTGPADPLAGKTVGSLSIGVDVKDESGWSGFVRADGQVSDDDKASAGVSAGVKAQW